MVEHLTCPVCGFRMAKELFRREGFNCPKCGTMLHGDESVSYTIAAISVGLAAVTAYLLDLTGIRFLLGTVVGASVLFLLGCVATAYYYPKLAVGLPQHGRVTLHIPDADDSQSQGRCAGEPGPDPNPKADSG